MPHAARTKKGDSGFNATAYIHTYYPPIASDDIDHLVAVARTIRDAFSKNRALDISTIVKESGLASEMVENLAIFDFQRAIARLILKEFPRADAHILDVGGGPTMYQHIALSPSAAHITHAEYSEENRVCAARWVRDEEQAHDWDNYFALVQRILKSDRYYTAILNRQRKEKDPLACDAATRICTLLTPGNVSAFKHHVRSRIGDNIPHCDIFEANLKLPHQHRFNIVTSNFVVESASPDMSTWERGMTHVSERVEPRGFFIHTAIKGATWYKIGKTQLPATSIDEHTLESFCKKKGLRILEMRILNGSNAVHNGYSGMVFLAARKV